MFGNLVLIIALLLGVLSAVMYTYTIKGYSNTLKIARLSFYGMSLLVIMASMLLLSAILSHNFEYKYVYEYSGSGLSTGLLMSTFYAGQEGSFLLWIFFTVIVGLILMNFVEKREGFEAPVMAVFSFVLVGLLMMVNPLFKSPFNLIWQSATYIDVKHINHEYFNLPFIQKYIYSNEENGKTFVKMSEELYALLKGSNISISQFVIQGKGLNPLLQNFWMQIHPPVLFVGFALSTVPYVFAFAAIIKNEYKNWIKYTLPWTLIGSMILGLSIMLGGYWAYGILGWGGYWGWDPVENASLVPWIVWVASIHTLLVQNRTQEMDKAKFVKLNLILSILVYVLIVYSTFLTRSGVLQEASVHSFVAPGRTVFLFLIIIQVLIFVTPFIGMFMRKASFREFKNPIEGYFSREMLLFAGAAVLLASALIIISATSAPIFGEVIDISFYNVMNLPLAIIMGLLIGIGVYVRWKKDVTREFIATISISSILSLVGTGIVVLSVEEITFLNSLFVLSALFTVFTNFHWAFKAASKSFLKTGAYITHIGVGVFFLGVVATGNYSELKRADLPLNETVSVFDHNLTFTGYNIIEGTEKYNFNVDVEKDGDISKVAPIMFISSFNNGLMREPDIVQGLLFDYYVTPLSYETAANQKTANEIPLKKGESYKYKSYEIIFDDFDFPSDAFEKMQKGEEFSIGANLTVRNSVETFEVTPKMVAKGNEKNYVPVEIERFNLKINLLWLDASGSIKISAEDMNGEETTVAEAKDTFAVEVAIKPFISLVWLGVFFICLGSTLAGIKRLKK